jgi:hypothetical protein
MSRASGDATRLRALSAAPNRPFLRLTFILGWPGFPSPPGNDPFTKCGEGRAALRFVRPSGGTTFSVGHCLAAETFSHGG